MRCRRRRRKTLRRLRSNPEAAALSLLALFGQGEEPDPELAYEGALLVAGLIQDIWILRQNINGVEK